MTRAWRALRRFVAEPGHRSTRLLRLLRPPGLFQPEAYTEFDRYPAVFAWAARELGADRPLKLLSFGCSTGEELLTLRRYFPQAEIVGLDINPHNVRRSRAAVRGAGDARILVRRANSAAAEPSHRYDAIFAMAVFRHGDLESPTATGSAHRIPFARFEAEVAALARCLRPGGLLFIAHSHFRFADTACAADFEVVLRETIPPGGPLFDRQGRRLPDGVYDEIGFRKRTAGRGPQP